MADKISQIKVGNTTYDLAIPEGYVYSGVAHISDEAQTPTQNCFKIATEVGTYSGYSSLAVATGEVAIFKYTESTSTWSKDTTGIGQVTISQNTLTIGGTPTGIKVPEGYEYIGIAHPDDAAVTHYSKVFYLAYQAGVYTNKGGFTKVSDTISVISFDGVSWSMQDVMIKYKAAVLPSRKTAYTTSALKWSTHTPVDGTFLPVKAGEKYLIRAQADKNAVYSLLTSDSYTKGSAVSTFVEGTSRSTLPMGSEVEILIPNGCNFLHFNGNYDATDYTPYVFLAELDTNDVIKTNLPLSVLTEIVGSVVSVNDGQARSNEYYNRSDFLPCAGLLNIDISHCIGASTVAAIAFYDSSKTYLSGVAGLGTSTYQNVTIPSSDIPAGATYMRFCCYRQTPGYSVVLNYIGLGELILGFYKSFDANASQMSEISTSISEISGDLQRMRKIVCPIKADGTSYTYVAPIKLEGGKRYRVIFANPSFSNYATAGNYKLGIYRSATSDGDKEIIKRWSGVDAIPLYYDILVDDAYPYISFGSRCNVEETLTAMILPLDAVDVRNSASITTLNPKEEFLPKFQSAKKRYYTSTINNLPAPIVIMQLSDIHANWANVSRFLEFCNEYSSFIDLKLNTGDTVSSQFSDGITGYDAITGVANIINVIGNHDTRGTGWQEYAGTQDAYDRYYANVASWGVTQPSGIGVDNYYPCYCYKDYADQKLRIIFVDVMAYDATEDAWLQSILADAVTNEYHVVIAAHMAGFMPNNSDIASEHIDCNWTSFYGREPITAQQTNGYNPYAYHMIESVDAFIADGGVFVGYLCGHSHYDFIAKKGTDNKQWIYTIGSSKAGEVRDYNHIVGTRNQDEFQIVSIDTHLGIVKLFKVGANVDLYGRHKNSICIDYINHTIKAEAF